MYRLRQNLYVSETSNPHSIFHGLNLGALISLLPLANPARAYCRALRRLSVLLPLYSPRYFPEPVHIKYSNWLKLENETCWSWVFYAHFSVSSGTLKFYQNTSSWTRPSEGSCWPLGGIWLAIWIQLTDSQRVWTSVRFLVQLILL